MSEQTDLLIIGAGAVGLAIACRFARPSLQVIILEKNRSFGQETSSRNSEVIHAGMYYPRDSLKAQLCVTGNRMLYEFARLHSVPFAPVGKLVIATEDRETAYIEKLYHNGRENCVPGLSLLTREAIAALEPNIRAGFALYSETTGIFDTHRYMQVLEKRAIAAGAVFAYHCTVTGIEHTHNAYRIIFKDADGREETLLAQAVINAAGLQSDTVAAMAGIDRESAGYKLAFLKGEYFNLAGIKRGMTSRLVYPVPGTDSLGIHTVLDLQGQLKLGPNAYYVAVPDYTVDESHKAEFYTSAKKFLPFLNPENLTPGMAGIRPKLQRPGSEFADFVICNEQERGLPGFINLIGIESPGLTASLAIAEYVHKML